MSRPRSSTLKILSSSDFDPITGELTDYECICVPSDNEGPPKPIEDLMLSESDEEAEDTSRTLWDSIVQQSEDRLAPLRNWEAEQKALLPAVPYQDGPVDYLNREIFPLLLPAMRDMLLQARQWKALYIQKCRFNGLDFLAEVLWNRNYRHPKRYLDWLDLFSIPPFKLWLRLQLRFAPDQSFDSPRPIFPKSWLWTEEEAALIIQKWVRGWLVRKRDDVQEMRQFWKAIIAEQEEEARLRTEEGSDLDIHGKEKKALSSCERFRSMANTRQKPF